MCLILLSYKSHPSYKLIIGANRDEFYNRPSESAHFWEEFPPMLAGRDSTAGGTWLGITTAGRLGMITNYREIKSLMSDAPSRGHLLVDYLSTDIGAEDYLNNLSSAAHLYNGFNLLLGDVDNLFHYSNFGTGITKINPGIHGLSNHLLNTPWFKVTKGKKRMEELKKKELIMPEDIFALLRNEELSPDDQLPETGLDYNREKAISSMFINTPDYGTKCSTAITVDYKGNVVFSEKVFMEPEGSSTERNFSFVV